MKRTLITFVLLLSAAVTSAAQDPVTGAFAGNVVDGRTRGPFAGATVELTNVATQAKYRRVTDDKGGFYAGRLSPGVYRIEISAPGFKTVTVEQKLLITQVNTLMPLPIVLEPAGDSGSDAKALTRPAGGPVNALPESARRYALVIGVGKYTADANINSLESGVNDAKAIADALVNYAGFDRDKVVLLTSDGGDAAGQPTKAVILRALGNMKGRAGDGSMLFVSFAGHGVRRQSDRRAFILPADASADPASWDDTAIPEDRLQELMAQTGASQVWLLLDTGRHDPTAGVRGGDERPAQVRAADFKARGGGVRAFVTFYATQDGQHAWEYREKKQGYLSWAFVEGLKGAARDPSTGRVTLARLVGYVTEEVPRRSKRHSGREQKPYVLTEGYGDGLVLSGPAHAPKP